MPKFKFLWPFWVALLGTIVVTLDLAFHTQIPFLSHLEILLDQNLSKMLMKYLVFGGTSMLLIHQIWANAFKRDYKWILSILLIGFSLYWIRTYSPEEETIWVFGVWAVLLAYFYTLRFYVKDHSRRTLLSTWKWLISITILIGSTIFAFLTYYVIGYSDEINIGFICLSMFGVLVLFYLNAIDRQNQSNLKQENHEKNLIEQIGQ